MPIILRNPSDVMGTKTSLRQILNIGCLNVRGCQNLEEWKTLIEDCQKYELQMFAVSETHPAGTSLEQHVTSDKQNITTKYAFFHTGSDDNTHHGVGLIIDQNLSPTFKRISDRICAASINLVTNWSFGICTHLDSTRTIPHISKGRPKKSPTSPRPDYLPRREPFRNQIDDIATKIKHRKCVTNSRSYGGIKSYTDRKLGQMSMNFQWHKLQKQKQRTNKTRYHNLQWQGETDSLQSGDSEHFPAISGH